MNPPPPPFPTRVLPGPHIPSSLWPLLRIFSTDTWLTPFDVQWPWMCEQGIVGLEVQLVLKPITGTAPAPPECKEIQHLTQRLDSLPANLPVF